MTKQKTAIITGASRGIGADIAKKLLANGFNIVVNYANNDKVAQAMLQSLENADKALLYKADISDENAVRDMFDACKEKWGGIDVLVNNAGILETAPLAEVTDAQFDQQFLVNVKGSFNTMRQAATLLNNGGRIINISSSIIGLYAPHYSVYAATKAAIEAMTRVLSKELGHRQITVNSVAPGPTNTELFAKDKNDGMVERFVNMTPLNRLGEPEDIANIVAFLASEEAGWISGQVIRSNGGII